MTISTTLVAAGTVTTNPAPNTLSPIIPATFNSGVYQVASAWTLQGKKAIFPIDVRGGEGDKPIDVSFVPSAGEAVTYLVTMWQFNRLSGTWIQPEDNATKSLTGSKTTFIDNPGIDPIFLQLSSISSGTIAIFFDGSLGRAL